MTDYDFRMTERHSGSEIKYYSKQKMNVLYPNEDYDIIGEIGNFAKKYKAHDIIVTDADKFIPIFPRGSLRKPFEWISGYVAVEENTYAAVVKSIMPKFG